MTDIIIIGAGPAGLTAGIYAKRNGKSVKIFEKNAYGGQIINAYKVENYPGFENISGFELATKFYNQAKNLGAEILFEEVINIIPGKTITVITNKNEYKCKKLILATGSKHKNLGLTLEDKLIGFGISYCATCDGAFYKKKNVAVVGGGNTAIMDALFLANYVNKVYLIYRGDKLKASEASVLEFNNLDNSEIIYNSEVIELNSEDNKLKKILIKNNKTGDKHHLDVDGLFIAIGQSPETDFINDLLKLDKNGYIESDNCLTKYDNIFVAGDVRTKEIRQLTTAISDGTIAAMEASK